MDIVALIAGSLLSWLLGTTVLLVLRGARRPLAAPGEMAWLAGAGYLAGSFLLTLWMRALSLGGVPFGVPFGVPAIALPCLAVTVVAGYVAWRRHGNALIAASRAAARALVASPGLVGAARVLWWIAIGWLALRFALLALEVAWRPLYPWDAWIQWATKAKVWYELGRIVPFARAEEWYPALGSVYFDMSPEYPPTMPLLQVWSCLLLGRWDDALMNWPWWQIALALALLVYGALRWFETTALAALAGAFLVSSLPLANVHVALAGYADLPMAAYYTAAALALVRWNTTCDSRDAALWIFFAFACTQIKNPGLVWAVTLLPAAIIAIAPKRGRKIIATGIGIALLLVIVLALTQTKVFQYELRLNFDPAWGALAESYFVLGNWHLLWYGAIGAALLAGRRLFAPPLAPVTTILAGGILFLAFVFAFSNARAWATDQTTVNRATLHLAPLIAVLVVLAFQDFAARWRAVHARATASAPAAR